MPQLRAALQSRVPSPDADGMPFRMLVGWSGFDRLMISAVQ
jgi:hypothetical protein